MNQLYRFNPFNDVVFANSLFCGLTHIVHMLQNTSYYKDYATVYTNHYT